MDEYSPKTIQEAVEAFMVRADLTDSDEDVLINTPIEKLDWLLPNFEPTIVRVTDLDKDNIPLLEACGSKNMSPHEAARVIMEKIWHYWRTGVIK